MSDFTPGPWVETGEALLVHADHIQPWNMAVCGPEGKTPEGLVSMVWGSSPEGVNRRARLIAAAPELLAALTRMLESVGDVSMDGYVENSLHSSDVEEARAAILKATERNAA